MLKKVKLTPLNIVTALSFAYLISLFIQPQLTQPQHIDVKGVYYLIITCLIIVTFVTDMIFRFTLKKLQTIWIVELVFIILTVILILILQK